MGDENTAPVSRETCKTCKENINKRIDELNRITEKRLDAHAGEIGDLKIIGERLTLVSEQNTQLLKELRQKHDEDVKEIKAEIKEELKSESDGDHNEKKQSYWDTEAGKQTPKWIVIGFIVIIVVIVAALVGTNLIELLKAAKDIAPTK